MRRDDWRQHLRAGDEVVLMPPSLASSLPRIRTVEKVMAHHFILSDDHRRKWRREAFGYVGQHGFGCDSVCEATPELRAKIAHLHRADRLSRIVWAAMPFDVTERACAALDEATDAAP
jgi:hypothetical protein